MNYVNHKKRARRAGAGLYTLASVATLGAGILAMRAMPDLIRYLRMRHM
jgi:hypothetical protein